MAEPKSTIQRLVIFGATGDLAARMLLPSLYFLDLDGHLPEDLKIIGSARSNMDRAAFTEHVHQILKARSEGVDDVAWKRFAERLDYTPADVTRGAGLAGVGERIAGAPTIFFLALSPSLYGPVCKALDEAGLACGDCRIVVEKPIGHDLESSRKINAEIAQVFEERRVFRIDHYLGKETVQNLLALRFGNVLFEPLWNAEHIDHVQITVAETLGVGQRVAYYDHAGALRDMVQNHILQLLCMVAMEPPSSLSPDAVRDEKLKVLRSLKPIDESNAAQLTVRGQYRAGAAEGQSVAGYLDELKDHKSHTESFVALKAEIANWRWAGVPFYLRTGKRLPERVSEIVVVFKPVPHSIFDASAGPLAQNRLVLRLQPDENIKLWVTIKHPGPGGLRLRHVSLDMSFAEAFGVQQPDAYERLILDVVRGNPTLFMRRDEVEAAWRWADPILAAWAESGEAPRPYTAGTWGPSAPVALIERDGRTWNGDSD